MTREIGRTKAHRMQWTGRASILAGPIFFLLVLLFRNDSMPDEAWKVIATAVWMLTWWVFEAVPIAVTSLLPIVLFPLTGILSVEEATTPYGSRFVFLFLGGFVLSLAMEKWNLHQRIALRIVHRTGTSANRIILGFMIASAFLSMWISNTATTVMMLPIAASIMHLIFSQNDGANRQTRRFALSLFLGIAYAANVGGIATLIGTPPNGVLADVMSKSYGIELGFLDWMKLATPFSIVMLVMVYFVLTKLVYPSGLGKMKNAEHLVLNRLSNMGKRSNEETKVLIVFVSAAALWIFKDLINPWLPGIQLNDTIIAIAMAVILFVLPNKERNDRILNWDDTTKLPWGILLLFGGGLSLASGFKEAGLIDLIAQAFQNMEQIHIVLLMLIMAFLALFLTEVMSNLALVSIFVPIVAAISTGAGNSPLYFAVPVTIAASCAFMLPMATPPNAIVFASGHIRIKDMVKAGIVLNLVACVMVTAFCYLMVEFWLNRAL